MADFKNEDVLSHTIDAFCETIALKLRQLRRYVPKEKALTNPALTGAFVEELVRGFIRVWLCDKSLLHGTFYSDAHRASGEKPLQIDGIVHVPSLGPLILQEGDFAIVHPAFCAGVVEIKMTQSSISDFEARLESIFQKHLLHLTRTHVLGVIVADKDPEKTSFIGSKDGRELWYHDYQVASWCPIFVLFTETDDGDYEPYLPGISGIIRAVFNNLHASTKRL